MKLLNKIMILGSIAFAMVACVDQEPDIQVFPNPDVDFTYEVIGDSLYAIDYYVVSDIQFINRSSKQGAIKWNFGTPNYTLVKGTETSDTVVVKFGEAGSYDVTLRINDENDEYYRTYPILIYDIVPRLSIVDNPMVILGETKVDFDIKLPNPGKKPVKYTWTFPDGALDAEGKPISIWEFTSDTTGVVKCPEGVSFSHLGSQKVYVDAIYNYGDSKEMRNLETSVFNVQVASPIEAPTLYYAQIGGNVKALKLVDLSQLPKGTKVYPYDLGVRAGENPFTLLYGSVDETNSEGVTSTSHWVYIIDAGKQYYYVNDVSGTLGDGKITAMRTDGTNVNTVITNVGGPAFSDPYQGCIYNGYIYYTDRNQGFSRVKMTDRGLQQENVLSGETYLRKEYVAKNDLIPYYNRPMAYGAISVGLYRDKNNVWWLGKNYSGVGIYLFTDNDIYSTQDAANKAGKPYEVLMSGDKFYCFTVDETNKKIYAWYGEGNTLGEGLAEYALPDPLPKPGESFAKGKIVKMDAKHGNSTDSEKTFVKQLAVDEESGKVYFGFRKDETDKSGVNQGIVVYDPNTGKISNFGETNDEIFGVVINPNKTKLF